MSLSYTRLVTDDSINPTSINTEDYTLPGSHYSYGKHILYIESVNEIWIPVSNTEYEPYWEAAPGIYAKFDLNTKIFKSFTTGELATSLESEDYAEGFYDTYNDCIWVYNGIGVIGDTNPKLAKFNSAGVLQFVVDSPTLYYSGDAAYTSYKVFANPNNGKVYSLARYTKVGGISLAVSILEIDVSTGSVSEVLCTINDADSTTYVTLDNLIFDSDNNIWVISNLRDRTTHDITSYSRILWIDVNTGTINTFNSRAVSHSLEYYINAIYNSVDNTILLQKEYYIGANSVLFLKIDCTSKEWIHSDGIPYPINGYSSFYLFFDPYRNCYWTLLKDYSLVNNPTRTVYYFAKLDTTNLRVIEEGPKSPKYLVPDLTAYDYSYAYTDTYIFNVILTSTSIIYPTITYAYTYMDTPPYEEGNYNLYLLNTWQTTPCPSNQYKIYNPFETPWLGYYPNDNILYVPSTNSIWQGIDTYFDTDPPGDLAIIDMDTGLITGYVDYAFGSSFSPAGDGYEFIHYSSFDDCIYYMAPRSSGLSLTGDWTGCTSYYKFCKYSSDGTLIWSMDLPTYHVVVSNYSNKIYAITKNEGISNPDIQIYEINRTTGAINSTPIYTATGRFFDQIASVSNSFIFDSNDNLWYLARDHSSSITYLRHIDTVTFTDTTIYNSGTDNCLIILNDTVDNSIIMFNDNDNIYRIDINTLTISSTIASNIDISLSVFNINSWGESFRFNAIRNSIVLPISINLSHAYSEDSIVLVELNKNTAQIISQERLIPYDNYQKSIIDNSGNVWTSFFGDAKTPEAGTIHQLMKWTPGRASPEHEMSLYLVSASDACVDRVSLSSNTAVQDLSKENGDFSYDESWSGYAESIQIGRYGYIINEGGYTDAGVWLHKIDLETFSIVGQINILDILATTYSINLEYTGSLAKSTDEKYLFISGFYDIESFILVKVNLETFTIIDASETLGWSKPETVYSEHSIFTCGQESGRIIVYLTDNTSPYDNYLVAFDPDTLAQIQSVNYTTLGYTKLMTAIDGPYTFFVGASRISDNRACMLRINEYNLDTIYTVFILDSTNKSASYINSITRINEHTYAVVTGSISYSVTYQSTHYPIIYFVEYYNYTLTVKQTLGLSSYTNADLNTKNALIYLDKLYILRCRTNADLIDILAVELAWNYNGSISNYFSYKSAPVTDTDKWYSGMLLYCYKNLSNLIKKRGVLLWVST